MGILKIRIDGYQSSERATPVKQDVLIGALPLLQKIARAKDTKKSRLLIADVSAGPGRCIMSYNGEEVLEIGSTLHILDFLSKEKEKTDLFLVENQKDLYESLLKEIDKKLKSLKAKVEVKRSRLTMNSNVDICPINGNLEDFITEAPKFYSKDSRGFLYFDARPDILEQIDPIIEAGRKFDDLILMSSCAEGLTHKNVRKGNLIKLLRKANRRWYFTKYWTLSRSNWLRWIMLIGLPTYVQPTFGFVLSNKYRHKFLPYEG